MLSREAKQAICQTRQLYVSEGRADLDDESSGFVRHYILVSCDLVC